MARVLILYATASGCTRTIAEQVATTLRECGADVELRNIVDMPELDGFDAAIVGSGVRGGAWNGMASLWVRRHAAPLRQIPFALFTVSLAIKDPAKRDEILAVTAPMLTKNSLTPIDVGLFPGWHLPETLPLRDRVFMDRKQERGDWRDLGAVADWARKVAPALAVATEAGQVS